MRIVSLLPSATEMLCEIGGQHLLVGRAANCDFPDSVAALPAVRADDLAALAPDLIITGSSRSEPGPVDPSFPAGATVLTLHTRTFEHVFDNMLTVGRAAGLAGPASERVVALRERVCRAADFVNPYTDGPVVAFLESLDPLTVAGDWTAQLVERAGGRHPLNATAPLPDAGDGAGGHGAFRVAGPPRRIEPADLLACEPEALVLCGPSAELTFEWWERLPAIRAGRIAIVDRAVFFRPGPRLVDAFEWLVGWLNDRPALIPPGFRWRAGR